MRTDLRKGLLVLFALFLCFRLDAQEHYFRHYDVSDGLSHNTIHHIVQDNNGFIWLGTKNGLSRFDGYSFKTFRNNPSVPTSLGDNFIESLAHSRQKLWVGTSSGLYCMDLETESFALVTSTNNKPILDIQEDNEGTIWFIMENKIHRYDMASNTFKNIPDIPEFSAEELTLSENGTIWIASPSRLFEYQKDKNAFKEHLFEPNLDNTFPFFITKISTLDNYTLLIGTVSHGAFLYDTTSETLVKLLPTNDARIFVRDFLKKNNNLWIATESGIYIYNLHTKAIKNLKKDFGNPYSLSDNAVYSLMMDKSGNIWAGTFFGGINYYNETFTVFKKYFPQVGKNSISGSAVREIRSGTDGSLWIGTEDAGLNNFNPKTGKFTNYTLKDLQSGVLHTNIHALLPLEDELWVGTFQNGLDVVEYKTGKVIRQYKQGGKTGLRSNFIVQLYQTESAEIIAVTSVGLYKYDSESDFFILLDGFPPNYFYTSFMQDSEGGQWAGTYWNGLYYYNPKSGIKKSFKKSNGAVKADGEISSDAINWMMEDSDGAIWVATEDGLNMKAKGAETFKRYDTENQFPSNIFYAIIETQHNNFWVSTANGLVKLHKNSSTIEVFTTENGLLSNQFNYDSAFKDTEGTLYFGGVRGMISFNPQSEQLKKGKSEFPLVLTNLEINNEEVKIGVENSPLKKALNFTEKIALGPDQSSLNIEFAALDYEAPKITDYAYKMQGLHNEWNYLGKENKVFFTKLPAGNYTFFLKAKVGNGGWSEEKRMLEIEMLPTFFASRVAYALYALIAGLIIYLVFRKYHANIEEKNTKKIEKLNRQKERDLYQAKIEFFTNISHEIITPLTLIKNPLDKILKELPEDSHLKGNLKLMSKNTSRLLDLVQQLLDFRKTEMDRIDLTFVETNVNDLFSKVQSRFSQEIKAREIDCKDNLASSEIHAFVDKEALRKIYSNLLNNALKYCDQKIRIRLLQKGDYFELRIKNDGKLIPSHLKKKIFEPFYQQSNEDGNGAGIGLSLSQSLAQLHNGTLELDSSISTMNAFVLSIPIRQEREFVLHPTSNGIVVNDVKNIKEHTPIDQENTAILLVEDNVDLLDFIAQDLREDYLVFKTSSAEEALQVLQNESIQLIISDIMMPGMNGIELCKKIKLDLEYSHIPIILLTSKSALGSKMEGLEAGADAYVEKPFSIDFLEVQIHNLLKNRKNIVQHFSSSPLAHIRSIAHTKTDETFIEKLDKVIHENISDHNLSVETLSDIMNMSRSTLYRKITELTELSPNNLINIARLKKAAELLKTTDYRISEVAFMVGYNSVTSFGRNFQKQFKMNPTEYLNSVRARRP